MAGWEGVLCEDFSTLIHRLFTWGQLAGWRADLDNNEVPAKGGPVRADAVERGFWQRGTGDAVVTRSRSPAGGLWNEIVSVRQASPYI